MTVSPLGGWQCAFLAGGRWPPHHDPSHQKDSAPFWFAANTWGSGWGDRGYFRIRRGENSCRIEQFVTAAFLQAGGRDRVKGRGKGRGRVWRRERGRRKGET